MDYLGLLLGCFCFGQLRWPAGRAFLIHTNSPRLRRLAGIDFLNFLNFLSKKHSLSVETDLYCKLPTIPTLSADSQLSNYIPLPRLLSPYR